MRRYVIHCCFRRLRGVDLFDVVCQSINHCIEARQLLLLAINFVTEFENGVIGERQARFQIIDPRVGVGCFFWHIDFPVCVMEPR